MRQPSPQGTRNKDNSVTGNAMRRKALMTGACGPALLSSQTRLRAAPAFLGRAAGVGALLALLAACAAEVAPARLEALLETGVSEELNQRTEERIERASRRNPDGASNFAELQTPAGPMSAAALIQSALERSGRIAGAAAGIAQADAERMNAIFGYLPQVRVGYQYDQIDQEVIRSDNVVFQAGRANYPVNTLTARINQPIFDLSRIFAITYAANARTRAEVEYLATVRAVVYEVLDAYIVASQAQARARALRQRMAILNRQISAQGALQDTGLGTPGEPASLRSERSTLASEEALELARYAEALSALSMLTGISVRQLEPVSVPTGALAQARGLDVEQLVARGLRENPAIMAAALGVVGAENQRRQALATDYSPVIDAYATLEREDRAASRFGGGSLTQDMTVGVQLTVPLFNARGAGYESRVAGARLQRQTLDYYGLRRQVETDIRTTHERMLQLATAIGQASSAAQQAGAATRAERGRAAAGESSDFAIAARELRQSQASERVAFYQAEYMRAWLRLQYLTGVDLRSGFR